MDPRSSLNADALKPGSDPDEPLMTPEAAATLASITQPRTYPPAVTFFDVGPIEPDPEPEVPDTPAEPETEPEPSPQTPPDPMSDEAYRAALARTIPRPETWDDVVGNKRVVELLREAVVAAKKQKIPLPHILLFSAPGMGKSTFAKLVARDMSSSCIETTASTLERPVDIIRILHTMNMARIRTGVPSVLFIDEIHKLGRGGGRGGLDQEAIYPLLEDWVFYHNAQGKKLELVEPDGTTKKEYELMSSTFQAWPFTCIGATTEPGILLPALLRRFLLQIELDPYTDDDLTEIIRRASIRMGVPISESACITLAGFCRRNPGRAFSLLAYARNRMVASEADEINDTVVAEIVERLRLYPLGLVETDVRVLEVLAARMPRGVGQAELSRALNISLNQFSQLTEPYLRQLDLVQTLNRRVLTPKGLKYLASINRADSSRPEIRAALAKIKN